VLSTSPTGNAHDWTSGSRSATRTARSRSPGTSTSRSARSTPPTSPAAGRKTAEKVLESLHTCPIPEVAKLGRTLRQWRTEILAYFDTGGVSNGGTEAINVIEKTRRLAHGFRNFTNYRIRVLLAAYGTRPYRRPPTKTRSAEQADPG
jgi:hypothetical protein